MMWLKLVKEKTSDTFESSKENFIRDYSIGILQKGIETKL